MKKIFTAISILFTISFSSVFAQNTNEIEKLSENQKISSGLSVREITSTEILPHKLFVIGNSTASVYGESLYPRTGWGQILQAFFNSDSILVVDKAISGRSSKSFYTDVAGWPVVLNEIGEGDFLFIEFGHNDEKSDDTTRYTDPYTTFQQYLSFYIDSARARGALPVLLTPIHRNGWSGDQIVDSHGEYSPAMRALATEKNVPLIDLTLKTEQLFESLGEEYVTYQIFMNLTEGAYPNYPSGNSDNTHTQENGALEICKLIIEGLNEINTNDTLNVLKNSEVDVSRVDAVVEPELAGTIYGKGIVSVGSTITLTPTAKTGYLFLNWTENDTLISRKSSLSFLMGNEQRTFTAHFIKTYNVVVKQTPYFSAEVFGAGYYGKDSVVTIMVSPKKGYKFIHWTLNDTVVSSDTAYSFIMGESNLTFTATFEKVSSTLQGEQDYGIELFPNPFSNQLTIQSERKILKVEVINLTGKVIYSENYNAPEVTLDLSMVTITPQICIARITTDERTFVSKIQKK